MRRRLAASIFLVFTVGLFACTTPYGPYGATGGYKDEKISENRYMVSFYGNGNTSGQTVWNFWIYRCAELTLEKGYEFFSIAPIRKKSSMNEPGDERLARFTMLDPNLLAQGDRPRGVPVYYYTTYYTVTTYSSRAIVTMYKSPVPKRTGILLDANTVKTMLTPYVSSNAKNKAPEKKNLLIRAMVEAAIRSNRVSKDKSIQLEKALRQRL